jgi:hypothetical protein
VSDRASTYGEANDHGATPAPQVTELERGPALKLEFIKGALRKTATEKRDYIRHWVPASCSIYGCRLWGSPRSTYYGHPEKATDAAWSITSSARLYRVGPAVPGFHRLRDELPSAYAFFGG